MRRGIRALGTVIVSAGAIMRCASRPASIPSPPPRTPIPGAAERELVAPDRWEALLVRLEDRRSFDPQGLGTLARSPDPDVRARVALAMGRIGDERAAGPLRALLADPSAEVRKAAAFAAGILGEPVLSGDLAPLLLDPDPRVAVRAAWSLGFLEQSRGQDALVAAVARAATPELRAAFLRGLWRFATPAAAAAALPFVADPDPRVRAAALYALARRPQESSLPALTAALADPDADTAALCARALGLLGRPESVEALGAAIEGIRTPVTINAMAALRVIFEKNPTTRLPAGQRDRLLSLAGDANPNLAVPALGLLRWFTEDRDVFRRLWAVASAGQLRRQQVALQSLMAGLGEKSEVIADAAIAAADPLQRAAAAEALSFLPEADAALRRARLATDPEAVVRLKVLEGLRTAEAVRANRGLVDAALSDADAGVRAAAIDALALSEDPGILPVLQEAVAKSYGDRAPDVAIEVIVAAENQAGRPEARAVVDAAYRHPSTLVSRLARRALVRTFHADPASLPWREYVTDKGPSEYAGLLSEARRPWTARIETPRGAFTVRLAGAEAPMTAMNFVALARKNFFDGVVVHRVVPNYVVQDGDPTGTGNGGPGYEIRDEINATPYVAGAVGMALAGPDTGGSQWFVTHSSQPHLDGIYTVFGQVTSGMDVVNRIEQGERILRVTVAAGSS